MKIIIQKYQLYPKEKPEGYAVGFNIQTYDSVTEGEGELAVSKEVQTAKYYKEQLVPLKDATGLSEDEIIDLAWQTVKLDVQEKEQELKQRPTYLGKEWIPIQDRKEPEIPETPEDPPLNGKV